MLLLIQISGFASLVHALKALNKTYFSAKIKAAPTVYTSDNIAIFSYFYKFITSRNFSESKIQRFNRNIEYQIEARRNFSDFHKFLIKHIVSKRNILLAKPYLSELKSPANNSKITFSLKFLLMQYTVTIYKTSWNV